jgi:hypothetical protein
MRSLAHQSLLRDQKCPVPDLIAPHHTMRLWTSSRIFFKNDHQAWCLHHHARREDCPPQPPDLTPRLRAMPQIKSSFGSVFVPHVLASGSRIAVSTPKRRGPSAIQLPTSAGAVPCVFTERRLDGQYPQTQPPTPLPSTTLPPVPYPDLTTIPTFEFYPCPHHLHCPETYRRWQSNSMLASTV